MYLLMLETNGNQRFVFSSPRQRENIGGSYLLTMLAPWTREIAGKEGISFEPVSESSGKIILTVQDEAEAQTLIGAVTRRVLALAPGMDVTGVFMKLSPDDTAGEGWVHVTKDDLREIHALSSRYALSRPPAEARFAQRPFLQRAADSVLPAAPHLTLLASKPPRENTYSLPSQVKRACAAQARKRLVEEARQDEALRELGEDAEVLLAESLKVLEDALDADPEEPANSAQHDAAPSADTPADPELVRVTARKLSRIAVVHIDGNGVGAIMRDLERAMKAIPSEDLEKAIGCTSDHLEALRLFLLKINERFDSAVKKAFFTAWAAVARRWQADHPGRVGGIIPVVPILLGGDDLTVLTEGRCALPFMEAYLRAYEEATQADSLLSRLGPRSQDGPGPMTAAAGAAIVPRPFPFHLAYDLAERLVSDAKRIGKMEGNECSTLTYHLLLDSTIIDAGELLAGYSDFTARPYRLDPVSVPSSNALRGAAWKDMLQQVAHFQGTFTEDVPAFPKSRAARIRSLLAKCARLGEEDEQYKKLTTAIAVEWEDARRVLGRDLIKAIGDHQYLFDLLELADLLPPSYLAEKTAPAGAEEESK